jgi:dTDP-4-dehydrorhamnose reductase
MRILVIGKNGQIGWELHQVLRDRAEVIPVGRSELDVTDREATLRLLEQTIPGVVINATGYNDVDGAERDQEQARSINAAANAFIAEAAKNVDAFFITYSSDYVFDGRKTSPYLEEDPPHPLNVYGQTKLDGERAIQKSGVEFLILRTSSVFSLRRPCFLTKVIEKAQHEKELKVRADLVSSPTSAGFLAEATAHLILNFGPTLKEYIGLFHLTSSGFVSRYEWAETINQMVGLQASIVPVFNNGMETAKRPPFSALDSRLFEDTFGLKTPDWKESLNMTLEKKL